MTTVPLRQWTVPEATDAQFRLVDAFHREFDGYQALDAGDYGAPADLGRSRATARVERVLADFFEAADATLVPGAGSGALRGALMASLRSGASVLVHDFPVYATTAVTFRAMGLAVARCDFNRPDELRTALAAAPDMVYVQHARQRLDQDCRPGSLDLDLQLSLLPAARERGAELRAQSSDRDERDRVRRAGRRYSWMSGHCSAAWSASRSKTCGMPCRSLTP